MLRFEKFGTKNLYRCLASILFVAALLMGCAKPQGGKAETEPQGTTQPQETVSSLQEALAAYADALSKESLDGLKLTIYYMDAGILLRCAMDTESLIQSCDKEAMKFGTTSYTGDHKIIVNNEKLRENVETLRRLNADNLVQKEVDTGYSIRMCCLFEKGNGEEVLRIEFGDFYGRGTVLVNGIQAADSKIFSELLEPLVDEETWNGFKYMLMS